MDEPTDLPVKMRCIFCGSNGFLHTIGTDGICHNGICSNCLDNLSKAIAGRTGYQRDIFVKTLLETSVWKDARKKIIKDAVAEVAKEMVKARRR